jgi:hypothetical protein
VDNATIIVQLKLQHLDSGSSIQICKDWNVNAEDKTVAQIRVPLVQLIDGHCEQELQGRDKFRHAKMKLYLKFHQNTKLAELQLATVSEGITTAPEKLRFDHTQGNPDEDRAMCDMVKFGWTCTTVCHTLLPHRNVRKYEANCAVLHRLDIHGQDVPLTADEMRTCGFHGSEHELVPLDAHELTELRIYFLLALGATRSKAEHLVTVLQGQLYVNASDLAQTIQDCVPYFRRNHDSNVYIHARRYPSVGKSAPTSLVDELMAWSKNWVEHLGRPDPLPTADHVLDAICMRLQLHSNLGTSSSGNGTESAAGSTVVGLTPPDLYWQEVSSSTDQEQEVRLLLGLSAAVSGAGSAMRQQAASKKRGGWQLEIREIQVQLIGDVVPSKSLKAAISIHSGQTARKRPSSMCCVRPDDAAAKKKTTRSTAVVLTHTDANTWGLSKPLTTWAPADLDLKQAYLTVVFSGVEFVLDLTKLSQSEEKCVRGTTSTGHSVQILLTPMFNSRLRDVTTTAKIATENSMPPDDIKYDTSCPQLVRLSFAGCTIEKALLGRFHGISLTNGRYFVSTQIEYMIGDQILATQPVTTLWRMCKPDANIYFGGDPPLTLVIPERVLSEATAPHLKLCLHVCLPGHSAEESMTAVVGVAMQALKSEMQSVPVDLCSNNGACMARLTCTITGEVCNAHRWGQGNSAGLSLSHYPSECAGCHITYWNLVRRLLVVDLQFCDHVLLDFQPQSYIILREFVFRYGIRYEFSQAVLMYELAFVAATRPLQERISVSWMNVVARQCHRNIAMEIHECELCIVAAHKLISFITTCFESHTSVGRRERKFWTVAVELFANACLLCGMYEPKSGKATRMISSEIESTRAATVGDKKIFLRTVMMMAHEKRYDFALQMKSQSFETWNSTITRRPRSLPNGDSGGTDARGHLYLKIEQAYVPNHTSIQIDMRYRNRHNGRLEIRSTRTLQSDNAYFILSDGDNPKFPNGTEAEFRYKVPVSGDSDGVEVEVLGDGGWLGGLTTVGKSIFPTSTTRNGVRIWINQRRPAAGWLRVVTYWEGDILEHQVIKTYITPRVMLHAVEYVKDVWHPIQEMLHSLDGKMPVALDEAIRGFETGSASRDKIMQSLAVKAGSASETIILEETTAILQLCKNTWPFDQCLANRIRMLCLPDAIIRDVFQTLSTRLLQDLGRWMQQGQAAFHVSANKSIYRQLEGGTELAEALHVFRDLDSFITAAHNRAKIPLSLVTPVVKSENKKAKVTDFPSDSLVKMIQPVVLERLQFCYRWINNFSQAGVWCEWGQKSHLGLTMKPSSWKILVRQIQWVTNAKHGWCVQIPGLQEPESHQKYCDKLRTEIVDQSTGHLTNAIRLYAEQLRDIICEVGVLRKTDAKNAAALVDEILGIVHYVQRDAGGVLVHSDSELLVAQDKLIALIMVAPANCLKDVLVSDGATITTGDAEVMAQLIVEKGLGSEVQQSLPRSTAKECTQAQIDYDAKLLEYRRSTQLLTKSAAHFEDCLIDGADDIADFDLLHGALFQDKITDLSIDDCQTEMDADGNGDIYFDEFVGWLINNRQTKISIYDLFTFTIDHIIFGSVFANNENKVKEQKLKAIMEVGELNWSGKKGAYLNNTVDSLEALRQQMHKEIKSRPGRLSRGKPNAPKLNRADMLQLELMIRNAMSGALNDLQLLVFCCRLPAADNDRPLAQRGRPDTWQLDGQGCLALFSSTVVFVPWQWVLGLPSQLYVELDRPAWVPQPDVIDLLIISYTSLQTVNLHRANGVSLTHKAVGRSARHDVVASTVFVGFDDATLKELVRLLPTSTTFGSRNCNAVSTAGSGQTRITAESSKENGGGSARGGPAAWREQEGAAHQRSTLTGLVTSLVERQ